MRIIDAQERVWSGQCRSEVDTRYFRFFPTSQGKQHVPSPDSHLFPSHKPPPSVKPHTHGFILLSECAVSTRKHICRDVDGDEEDDVRIRAHMDFIEHTFPVRFSAAPPGIPWCGGENQNKTHDRRHSTRSPPSFSPSVNLPGCGCMKGILQRFIGYRSLLGAAAMLLPLPYCDNSRSDVYREEERWFCHWLPRGQPHWSIWPNCANPCVRRMEPLTDIGWQTGSMALQRCLFKGAPLRPLLPCTNSRNSHFEQVKDILFPSPFLIMCASWHTASRRYHTFMLNCAEKEGRKEGRVVTSPDLKHLLRILSWSSAASLRHIWIMCLTPVCSFYVAGTLNKPCRAAKQTHTLIQSSLALCSPDRPWTQNGTKRWTARHILYIIICFHSPLLVKSPSNQMVWKMDFDLCAKNKHILGCEPQKTCFMQETWQRFWKCWPGFGAKQYILEKNKGQF